MKDDFSKRDDKRAKRRASKEVMKDFARRIYPHDQDGKLADHLAQCSCSMCGNPRKYGKGEHRLTRQERIVFDRQRMD